MAWREVSVMGQRYEFVRLATAAGANVSALCRRFGVSRPTGYKWLARHAAGGGDPAALADRPRRPKASPGRTADAVERLVLGVRGEHPTWGGRKIVAALRRRGHDAAALPAASTATAILRRHGLIDPAEAAKRGPLVRFERAAPNELWQMDFKGHFATAAGRCHPLTVLDDHSRFNLVLAACGDERTETVRGHLAAAFRRYGMPWAVLCGNGPPFGGEGAHGLTPLAVWLLRLGVGVTHGRPYHPQTQGKDERFHRTLKADVIAGRSFADPAHAQRHFDPFREVYNFHRPHEALAMATPADRWRPSPRPFPEALPAIEYAPGDEVRRVQGKGEISFRGRCHPVAACLHGLPVAVRPAPPPDPDGLYGVYFCAHRVAQIDLRAVQ
jgi:transposase InsO family protein